MLYRLHCFLIRILKTLKEDVAFYSVHSSQFFAEYFGWNYICRLCGVLPLSALNILFYKRIALNLRLKKVWGEIKNMIKHNVVFIKGVWALYSRSALWTHITTGKVNRGGVSVRLGWQKETIEDKQPWWHASRTNIGTPVASLTDVNEWQKENRRGRHRDAEKN